MMMMMMMIYVNIVYLLYGSYSDDVSRWLMSPVCRLR